MGQLPGPGQDGNTRLETGLDSDEGAYQSTALSKPSASKSSPLPVRRRSVYPPYNPQPTATSDSVPVHEEATSDAKAQSYMRSSIGRLSLRNSGHVAGKTPLGPLLGSTPAGHLRGGNKEPGSRGHDTTGIGFLPETLSPLTIRNHIEANLKAPGQDKNGVRIPRAKVPQLNHTFGLNNWHTVRRESNHHVPTTTKETKNEGNFPRRASRTSSIRHRKSKPPHEDRCTVSEHDKNSGHGSGSSMQDRPQGRGSQMIHTTPRLRGSRDEGGSFDERHSAPRLGMKRLISTGDADTVHPPFKAKRRFSNSTSDVSFSDSDSRPPHGVNRATTARRSGKNVDTRSTESHTPLPYTLDRRPMTYTTHYPVMRESSDQNAYFNQNPSPSSSPGGTRTPTMRTAEPRSSVTSINASPSQTHTRPSPAPRSGAPVPEVPQLMRPVELHTDTMETHRNSGENPIPRASNRFLDKVSNTGDSLSDINFTISKDSSADERVRSAKLLAELGGRKGKSRGGNDVATDGRLPAANQANEYQKPVT